LKSGYRNEFDTIYMHRVLSVSWYYYWCCT